MRHSEPDFVTKWRQSRDTPKCCHTCAFYTEGGSCEVFNGEPTPEWANTVNMCEKWEDEVPS